VRFNGDDTKRVNSNYIYDNCPQATCPVCPPGGCTNLNTWFHVAATYDGATIRLYINGVLDQSLANAFTINNNNIDLTIGADVSGSDTRDLQGLVDDVRIYNGTLSANDIRDLACVGNAGASCDDGVYCNGTDICGGGVCGHDGDPCPGADGDGNCAESCDEATDACTASDPNGSACNDATFCNGADTCSSGACTVHAGDPCVGGSECADSCDEPNDSCNDPGGTPCGGGANTSCDNPDTCDGSGSCANNYEPGTTLCRGDAGSCDVAEFCDGAGSCPTDGFESPGTPCGSPSDTICDDPDTCDAGGSCQTNPEPGTTVCRPDAGDCDVEELCDGAGACPSDVLEPNGTGCDDTLYCTVSDQCTAGACAGAARDCSASGDQCRVGTCNESANQCDGPAKPDGTACNDDDACTVPDTCAAGECEGVPDSLACLDHFSCYKSKTTSGTPKFLGLPSVSLVDAFSATSAAVGRTKALCAPVSRNGEDPTAPSHPDHLQSYQVRPVVKFPGATVGLTDPLGNLTVLLTKPSNLLVPTAKSMSSPPTEPSSPIVDHFQCYKVKVTTSDVALPALNVSVEDQFGTQTAELRKLKYACVPVNKNGEEPGAETNSGYLTCYQQKSLPKFVKKTPVFTANQFGSETMDVLKPSVLCLPAARLP
jgi:hypothetical protein